MNVPVDPTSARPGALYPSLRIGPRPWSNRTSHRLTRLALWLTVRFQVVDDGGLLGGSMPPARTQWP